MTQHFLLSAQARSISLKAVFSMGEDKAYETFRQMRWSETDGGAVCPRCGCYETYDIATRRKFKCVACHHQFSVTSGTIFASRKMTFTDLLAAIVIFVNGAKGVAALQLSRDLDCQYKTAFILTHKLREAMALEQQGRKLDGIVEIDGGYFGGHVKPENRKEDRKDRRLKANTSGKRQCVVIMRERKGRSLPFVVRNEGDAVPYVRDHVGTLATIHADEGTGWDALHAGWDTHRVNHSVQFRRKATSHAFAGWKSERTTISPVPISASMRVRLHGAKITAAFRTALRRLWWRKQRWLAVLAGTGRGIGRGRPKPLILNHINALNLL
jgi:transposase-like protein